MSVPFKNRWALDRPLNTLGSSSWLQNEGLYNDKKKRRTSELIWYGPGHFVLGTWGTDK